MATCSSAARTMPMWVVQRAKPVAPYCAFSEYLDAVVAETGGDVAAVCDKVWAVVAWALACLLVIEDMKRRPVAVHSQSVCVSRSKAGKLLDVQVVGPDWRIPGVGTPTRLPADELPAFEPPELSPIDSVRRFACAVASRFEAPAASQQRGTWGVGMLMLNAVRRCLRRSPVDAKTIFVASDGREIKRLGAGAPDWYLAFAWALLDVNPASRPTAAEAHGLMLRVELERASERADRGTGSAERQNKRLA